MDEHVGEGFDDFYRGCRTRIAVQIAALTGDSAEALDHVQEAFVRAWARWPYVTTLDNPEAWVRRVAYNLAVSRFRRTRRLVLGVGHVDGVIEFDESARAVLDSLERLPRREREALLLKHLVGLSVAEIAGELGVPQGTVKSWLSRGRAHLSAVMAEELDDMEELDEAR